MADRNPGQENRFEMTRRAVLSAVGAGDLREFRGVSATSAAVAVATTR
ncbi:hypothetical protein ACFFQF_26020 [Haladaptatus pallidirubidus]